MEKTPQTIETEPVPEYSFEEGVDVAAEKIKELYEKSDKDVIIEINGSSINVGKTELLRNLAQKLGETGIPLNVLNDPTREYYDYMKAANTDANGGVEEKGVYIVATSIGKMYHSTKEYRELNRGELSIDLYIGIYRPDKPFGGNRLVPVADIMIRNEGASDKPKL